MMMLNLSAGQGKSACVSRAEQHNSTSLSAYRPRISQSLRQQNRPYAVQKRLAAGSGRPFTHFIFAAASVRSEPKTAAPDQTRSADDYEKALLDCVVVGGGISGLCTAQAFVSDHAGVVQKFLVTEARERVGGNITSRSNDEGYTWEEGPNSFQPNDSMLKAALDAGVAEQLVFGDPKAPRFVYWNNKLRPTPSGPDVVTFDLLSIWGKIRAGLGAAGLFKKPMPAFEESVEQFVRRNLGDEVFERLIEPFCSGVYAGDPTKLSMKAAFGKVHVLEEMGGSIVGGALKLMKERKANPPPPRDPNLPEKPKGQTVGSFRKGLQTLPEAIARNLADNIRVNWKLQDIYKKGDTFVLRYDTPEGPKELKARSVALTVPAYIAADLLRRECVDAADSLKSLDYPPVAAVTVAYPNSAFRDDRVDSSGNIPGFGQLHPRSQGVITLGTIYSSSLFPNRAPNGEMLLCNYIGGATNRGIVDQNEDDIVAQVDRDLRLMLIKPDAPKAKKIAVRVWPKAIPQFNVGHLDVVKGAKEELREAGWGGVFLGGNYVAGVALGKCVEFAYEYAADVAKYLESQGRLSNTSGPEKAQDEAFFV
ncbi:hypothetical protein WJX72_008949 [[Myrmecia] bisecta]|uniref:Protoporphyrinogen oxidase n=1 Tax=[Myrmecia] bisecta TaxID=41462 RepID=A0AAW1P8G5_9CHLO